jgi:hypothetical protein
MSARETIGLGLIVIALVLTPVAWTTSRMLWILAFLTFVLGLMLFLTGRVQRRLEESSGDRCSVSDGRNSRDMPTDIHNYTGWRSGGRSETMDSSSENSDGD